MHNMKVAEHAVLATIHAHRGNPNAILESLAADCNGTESGSDGILRHAIIRCQNRRSHGDTLLGSEEGKPINSDASKVGVLVNWNGSHLDLRYGRSGDVSQIGLDGYQVISLQQSRTEWKTASFSCQPGVRQPGSIQAAFSTPTSVDFLPHITNHS